MVKVLVVEDSPTVRELLVSIMSADPAIEVIGTAHDGVEALQAVSRLKPDIITMDVNMPRMNGFETTRRIMETCPLPIIIISGSWEPQEVAVTFQAMDAGALTVLARPVGIGHPEFEASARQMVETVKLMSEVKVVRRWSRVRGSGPSSPAPDVAPERPAVGVRMVAIGASTGGPVALQTILSRLPREFPVPILIVQHIAPGFVSGFVDWLNRSSGVPVRIAEHGEPALPGCAYVAPDGVHLGVENGNRVLLSADNPENGLRPSVAYLFRSVIRAFGPQAIGVLLTGMGRDGAEELKRMQERGAVTIAQDRESSVVHGMPGEAIKLKAAGYVLAPGNIAETLVNLVKREPYVR